MVKKVTKWVSADNKLFDTEKGARDHDLAVELCKRFKFPSTAYHILFRILSEGFDIVEVQGDKEPI